MKNLILTFLLITSTLVFSQEPFRYDTIRVSSGDSRNIYKHQQHQRASVQNQKRRQHQRPTRSLAQAGFDARNLRYGLNLGLHFSNDYSLFRLAPQLGYQFSKYFMAGAGVSYYHSKNTGYIDREKITHYNNSLGANLFGYFYPASFLAISLQPEINHIWASSKNPRGTYSKRNVTVPSVVVGAGLRLGYAHAMIYYDLVQDIDSPYTSGLFYGVSVYF